MECVLHVQVISKREKKPPILKLLDYAFLKSPPSLMCYSIRWNVPYPSKAKAAVGQKSVAIFDSCHKSLGNGRQQLVVPRTLERVLTTCSQNEIRLNRELIVISQIRILPMKLHTVKPSSLTGRYAEIH